MSLIEKLKKFNEEILKWDETKMKEDQKSAEDADAPSVEIPRPGVWGPWRLKRFSNRAWGVALAVIVIGLLFSLWRIMPNAESNAGKIAAATGRSMVLVTSEGKDGKAVSGDGFFISGNGVLTCAGLVEGAERISVKASDGRVYDAVVGDNNPTLNLALLLLDEKPAKYGRLKLSFKIPEPGTGVIVVSSQPESDVTAINATILDVRKYDDNLTILEIGSSSADWPSGSPVVDLTGRVLGITTLTDTVGQNRHFAVSYSSIQKEFKRDWPYLVRANVPIVKDTSRVTTLRNIPYLLEGLPLSRGEKHATVLDKKKFTVRMIVKVRSSETRAIYWIDSDNVKTSPEVTLEEFIDKFNYYGELLGRGESLLEADFGDIQEKSVQCANGPVAIHVQRDAAGFIDKIVITLSGGGVSGQAGLHPWMLQSVGVFYPNLAITDDLFRRLDEMASRGGGRIEVFPATFEISVSPAGKQLTISLLRQ